MFRLVPVRRDPARIPPIAETELTSILSGATVLVGGRGKHPKVALTTDGRIVKHISKEPCGGALDREPRALRFARHVLRLRALGFPVPEVERVHSLDDGRQDVLIYRPLSGVPLRDAARRADDAPRLLRKFAATCAGLHDAGVLFRSGHLANYILMDDGNLGLIDVHALSFTSGPASIFRRARTFRILVKDDADRLFLASGGGLQSFLDAYVAASSLGPTRARAFRRLVWLMHPRARAVWSEPPDGRAAQ